MGFSWLLHTGETRAAKDDCSALSHAALPSFCDDHHRHSHVLDSIPQPATSCSTTFLSYPLS